MNKSNRANKTNPFTVIFGLEPYSVIPRKTDYEQIVSVFDSERPRTYAYVITGVRGVGKTVLLSSVQKYYSDKNDWYVLRLNPDIDLFESAISQLGEYITLAGEQVNEASINVMGFGVGGSKKSLSNNETILKKMLKHAAKDGKRVLFAVDEATNSNNLKTFFHSYQAFLGEQLPVFLLMTALPENFYSLSSSKNGTFLKRMPKIILGQLNSTMIRNSYMEIFKISEEAATSLAKIVKGYPYAYQVLGDILWENNSTQATDKVLREFDAILDDCVYLPIWEHLSEMERKVIKAIAGSKKHTVKEIREQLNMESNELSPYRDRLSNYGIIDTKEYGKITFTLPRFEVFVAGR